MALTFIIKLFFKRHNSVKVAVKSLLAINIVIITNHAVILQLFCDGLETPKIFFNEVIGKFKQV